jgi:pyrroloquinoline quinone biosynthesis protein B
MKIRVLGSAAGGGFPQWNCGCPNCSGVRDGSLDARARTQESLAVSADGGSWFLLNASPEIRSQIEGFRGLHPRGPRDSPIAGILITNGDLDHCLGLLSLRESHPLQIYATEQVRRGFTESNSLYTTLERFAGQVTWHALQLGFDTDLKLANGRASGLEVEALAVPGQPPLHLRARFAPGPEDNVALRIRDRTSGRRLVYMSGVAAVTPAVLAAIDGSDCLFFDGTFWAADELIALGLGDKRAEDMAHLPIGGAAGSLAQLAHVKAPQRIYIHINNTNPILREDSAERAAVQAAGWQVAYDGLEFEV